MLYLIATPIGNLSDITFRAVEVMKSCDYILCEDTRHSRKLLTHYDIHKPVKSFHKFNEVARLKELIEDLQAGKNIALISDAGTPAIADPGEMIVKRCREENIDIFSLPGPCAAIAALTISALSTQRFQFIGFLPKKKSLLKQILIETLHYPGTSIAYESPHRIIETLQEVAHLNSNRKIVILRELTKLHEEYLQGTASELLNHFQQKPPLGELVLLVEGKVEEAEESPLSPQEQVKRLQLEYGISLQEAIKLTASLQKVPKRTIYNLFHHTT